MQQEVVLIDTGRPSGGTDGHGEAPRHTAPGAAGMLVVMLRFNEKTTVQLLYDSTQELLGEVAPGGQSFPDPVRLQRLDDGLPTEFLLLTQVFVFCRHLG